ncbi:ABC transporter-related protein [Chloroherpeton thalassium ATCC 35110]|uniref:ABC transporter-related protein n=1 Tax=Chloroherpeton thalassium (strain ATCC 35110 / GB-78) TaxID=517418 RepID=B3QS97_CHLT3|nr:ATP-binding cassette domain-containing protein [Chloroherpeton thalassium]ACF12488.1 ABC transporter-related protein [Chloroherpeton thalassium ATCC 35110]
MQSNKTQDLETQLEQQIISLFEYLNHTGVEHLALEHLYEFLEQEPLHPSTLFERLEKNAQDAGLSLRRMQISADHFFEKKPVHSLILRAPAELMLIEEIQHSDKTVKLRSFATNDIAIVPAATLFKNQKSLDLLCYDGTIYTYMTSGKEDTAFRSKAHSTHQASDAHKHHEKTSVLSILDKLIRLLKEEQHDFLVVLGYAIIVGLLSLVMPLSAQAIVNTVALGVYSAQLVSLCIVVGIGLIILGAFEVMKRYVVDVLQRRLFVRTAFEIAHRLPRIRTKALENEYAPELVNRFFDVMTVQKTIGKFLLDGVSATLIALSGLILLGIYHPIFLLFNVFLLIFVPVLIFVLGRGGLELSIKESKKKYALASWLEDIARCQTSFKMNGSPEFIYRRVDEIATEYVKARDKHFSVLIRQLSGSYIFRALASVGVLGIGGALVIEQQISLGQLVAAELVIVAITASLEKLVEQFEFHYDLLTAIDKISHVTDKELDPVGGELSPDFKGAVSVNLHDVTFSYTDGKKVLENVSLEIPAGGRVSLVGKSGAGKTTLMSLIAGLNDAEHGVIEFNGYDISRMNLKQLHQIVAIVPAQNEIFEGTIEENILMGRAFDYEQMVWALKISQMYDDIRAMPNRLKTPIISAGRNLPGGLIRKIMIARAIIGKPKVLILDEAFGGMEENTKLELIRSLYSESSWTIIDISHDAEVIRRSEPIYVLHDKRIVETYMAGDLATKKDTLLGKLFPDLARQIIEERKNPALAKPNMKNNSETASREQAT